MSDNEPLGTLDLMVQDEDGTWHYLDFKTGVHEDQPSGSK